jgi:dolichol-phosphate mannosyltransferase
MARRYRWGFAALLAAVVAFRLWFVGSLPLSGDEAYHWEWARHPALGYYDHPALTAWLIGASTRLLGRSTEFTVRLPAVLMLTLAALAVRALARDAVRERGAGGTEVERAGFLAGVLALVVPIYGVFGVYISTDPPLLAFWPVALLCVSRAVGRGGWGYWVAAGAALGLAALGKFLAFFLALAVGAALLAHPDGRRWLKRPHPYAAGVCAAAVFAPVVVWNATHGWATFLFNFVYRQGLAGWELWHVPEFVAGQALALSPAVFVLAVAALGWALRGSERRRFTAVLLALSALVPLAYLLWCALSRQIGMHWPAAAWSGALVLMVCREAAARSGGAQAAGSRRLWTAGLWVCALMTVTVHAAVHIPPRWLRAQWAYGGDPGRISFGKQAERFGWEELGRFVGDAREEMRSRNPDGSTGVFVMADQYGLAAQLAFYMPGQPATHLWSRPRTHGENYRYWDDFAAMKGQDAIFVSKSWDRMVWTRIMLGQYFKGMGKVEALPIVVDGREVRAFYLVRCYRFDGREPVFPVPKRKPRIG